MTRIDLTLAILAILLIAMIGGWLLHWLWGRLSRAPVVEVDHLHDMAERLHEAEDARVAAEKRLAEIEVSTRTTLAERKAEIEDAMDTIGTLRRQIHEWQAAYEELQGKKPEA